MTIVAGTIVTIGITVILEMEIHCFVNSFQPYSVNDAQASNILGFVLVFRDLMVNTEKPKCCTGDLADC